MSLPFFEDFTRQQIYTQPDPDYWLTTGGVFINDAYAINPPSYNVATFDGLNASGIPYDNVNPFSLGYTDVLTSAYINTAGLVPADSLFISFYWQAGSVGEVPDNSDFIELQLRDKTNNWNTIWTQYGNSISQTEFTQEIIKITDSKYFFDSLQFRFRSYGRQSGAFDIWNIDYIYLNKNRNSSDLYTPDWTISNASVSFLKNYTAMPYNQYFANKTAETDVLRFSVNNLSNTVALVDYTIKIENNFNTIIDNAITGFDNSSTRKIDQSWSPTLANINNINQPQVFWHTFRVRQFDSSSALYGKNNSYTTATWLWDTYAYDDGTAEYGIGADQQGAKLANQFILNIPDVLTHISIRFVRSRGPNMDGRSVLLCVWDKDFNLLRQVPVQVKYGEFAVYSIGSPLPIEANEPFYVGYQQNFNELLTVGYDKNINRNNKIFFNTNSGWENYASQPGALPGALMIRAVLSKGENIIPVKHPDIQQNSSIKLFPNPASDHVCINGEFNEIILLNYLWQPIKTLSFTEAVNYTELPLYDLPAGIYYTLIKSVTHVVTKKIFKQ